ncbi:MAG: N-acetylmuramoyl-L-alanine amidase [Cyanophyceae cyanobacterium]
MRDINKIIVHCSATPEGRDISASTINEWHKERGWSGIGYHYVIKLDGLIEHGRDINKTGAHVKNHNKGSIGICYIGGCNASMSAKDTRTPEQKESLLLLLKTLKKMHPRATIHGHNEFSAKACPCFNANEEYCNI